MSFPIGRVSLRRGVHGFGWALCVFLVAAGAQAAELTVEYLSADRVYVDGGAAVGLRTGQRLEVERDGRTVAVLEVAYVARHSASCRVVEAYDTVVSGDRIEFEPRLVAPRPSEGDGRHQGGGEVSSTTVPSSSAATSLAAAPEYSRSAPEPRLTTSVNGSLSVDFEQFTDGSELERDFDRTAARVRLRGRNLGGTALQLRVRGSTRSLDRVVNADGRTETSTRDRLYELTLAWEPPEGRFSLRLGRLRLGRYAGVGTLDGAYVEGRVAGGFHLGAFGGSRSDLSEFGFDSDRTSVGVTARWAARREGPRKEFLIAGVREEGAIDVSREYVALQSRVGGPRWTFYQRAELDLNNGWREETAASATQLSTLFVNLVGRISSRHRVSLSYSRFERYRTEETRFIPEELFDENLRQGLRLRWTVGESGGWQLSLSAGTRERDGDSENATSAGVGVSHANLFGRRWSVAVNALTFSNAFGDGTTGRLSVGKRLEGGHRLRLTAGSRLFDDLLLGDERQTIWVRLGAWFELPGALYGRCELEATEGDEIEGQRVLVGFGYRL